MILHKPCLAQEISVAPEGLQEPCFGATHQGLTLSEAPGETKTFSEAERFDLMGCSSRGVQGPCRYTFHLLRIPWPRGPEGITGITRLSPTPFPQKPLVLEGNVGVFVVGEVCYFPSG